MRGRQSRRPIPSSLDYGSGTWTEVLYWLARRARHCRRQALRISDLKLVHNYRIHAEICEELIGKLDHNLRLQAYLENGADNTKLSA